MARGRIVDILRYVFRLDTGKFDKDSKGAEGKIGKLASSLGNLGGVVAKAAAAFGLFKLGDFALDLAQTAARTEVLGTVLSQVAKTTGTSKNELISLREQLKALGITTQEATGALIKFLGNDLPIEKVNALADAARNVAVVMGNNTSQAFATLTRAIITQNTVLLKNAGLSIDLESKFSDFAKTQGIAAEQVTRAEKRMIVLNAVLERAAPLAGAYTAAMTNVGKRVTSLPRLIQEASNAVGRFFVPAFGLGVDSMSAFLKFITRQFSPGIETLRTDIAKVGRDLVKFNKTAPKLDSLRNEFVTLSRAQAAGAENQGELNRVISEMDTILPGISLLIRRFAGNVDDATTAIDALIRKQRELRSVALLETVKEQADVFADLERQIRENAGTTLISPDLPNGFTSSLRAEVNLQEVLTKRLQDLAEQRKALEDAQARNDTRRPRQIFQELNLPESVGRRTAAASDFGLGEVLKIIQEEVKRATDALDESRTSAVKYSNTIKKLKGDQDQLIDQFARTLPTLTDNSDAYLLLEDASKKAGLGLDFVNKVQLRQIQNSLAGATKRQLDEDEKLAAERERIKAKEQKALAKIVKDAEKELVDIRAKAAQEGAQAEFDITLTSLLKTKRAELQAAGQFATERGKQEAEVELKFLAERQKRAFEQAKALAEVDELAAVGAVTNVEQAKAAITAKFDAQARESAQRQADALAAIAKSGVTLTATDTEAAIARASAAYDSGQLAIDDYVAKVRELLNAEKNLIEESVGGDVQLLSPEAASRLSDVIQQMRDLESTFVDVKNQKFGDEIANLTHAYQSGSISGETYRKELQKILKAQLAFLRSLLATEKIPEVIRQIQQAIEDVNSALVSTADEMKGLREVAGDVANALNGWSDALDVVDSHFADLTRSGGQLAGAIATGNAGAIVASGIDFGSQLISTIGGLLSRNPQAAEDALVAERIAAEKDLADANERLISSVDNLARQFQNQLISDRNISIDTLREAQDLVDAIKAGSRDQSTIDRLNEILKQFGIDTEVIIRQIPDSTFTSADNIDTINGVIGLLLKELFGELESAKLFTDPFGDLRTSGGSLITDPVEFAKASFDTMIKILREIAKRGGESGDLGKDLISFWTNFGDLSLEQQRDLLHELIDGVTASGDITDQGLLDLKAALETIDDRIAEQNATQPDAELSQTRRSVTTITESQANLISGTLNSMLLVMREINNSMKSFLDRASVSLSPSIQTIFQTGAIQVVNNNRFLASENINKVTVLSIEEQLKANARSIGIK